MFEFFSFGDKGKEILPILLNISCISWEKGVENMILGRLCDKKSVFVLLVRKKEDIFAEVYNLFKNIEYLWHLQTKNSLLSELLE